MLNQAFGDSITVGVGASVPSKSWIGLMTPTNSARAGDQAAETANIMLGYFYPSAGTPVAVNPAKTYSVMIGANDVYVYKNVVAKQAYYEQFLRTVLVLLSCPTRLLADDASVVKTGSWSTYAHNQTSTAINSTLQYSVSGEEIYIGWELQDNAGAASAVEVRIDGVLVDTLSSYGPGLSTTNGSSFSVATKRYSGLSAGSHTVNLKLTTSGKQFYMNYIAGSDQMAGTKILLSNVIKMSPSFYTSKGISVATTDAFNTIITNLIAELNGDGANITLVDNYASIDPTNDLAADGIHPNDAGHAKISANFSALI